MRFAIQLGPMAMPAIGRDLERAVARVARHCRQVRGRPGRLPRLPQPAGGARRRPRPRPGVDSALVACPRRGARGEVIRDIAWSRSLSAAQVALAGVLHRDRVTTVPADRPNTWNISPRTLRSSASSSVTRRWSGAAPRHGYPRRRLPARTRLGQVIHPHPVARHAPRQRRRSARVA